MELSIFRQSRQLLNPWIFAVGTAILVSGCETFETKTGLNDTQRYTGTATVLRIDDAWHPDSNKRGIYQLGTGFSQRNPRFVPLRGKDDVAGLDVPARIVTDQDYVTITLNYSFLKFFKEIGGARAKGEIAMILSFDAGTTAKNSIVVHSSRGQTLGSFMNFQDWPVIGPVKIDSDSLRMRVVLLELDQQENEQFVKIINSFASLATTIQPQLGPVAGIATNIAEALIRANPDDVVLAQKFALPRVQDKSSPTRSPLLFGKYVLVLQEDKLASAAVEKAVPRAVLPPVVDDLRYDLHSDRLYKIYGYRPHLASERCSNGSPVAGGKFPNTLQSVVYEGKGRIDYSSYFTSETSTIDPYWKDAVYRNCIREIVNSSPARKIRAEQLGYMEPEIGDLEIYGTLDAVLDLAYLEGIRHSAISKITSNNTNNAGAQGELKFNYPVSHYPEAFTVLAQYPIHTHIVFSIDKSLGGIGGEFHEDFKTFEEFMEDQKKTARDNSRISQISAILDNAIKDRRKQQSVMKKAANISPAANETKDSLIARKVCVLWKKGLNPQPSTSGEGGTGETPQLPVALSNAPIYNEIFHLTGEHYDGIEEVTTFLRNQENVTVNENGTECTTTIGTAPATPVTPERPESPENPDGADNPTVPNAAPEQPS